MSARAAVLAIGLVVVAVAGLLYTGSINAQFNAVHDRLERVELAVAALATLPPGFVLDPPPIITPLRREERPPPP